MNKKLLIPFVISGFTYLIFYAVRTAQAAAAFPDLAPTYLLFNVTKRLSTANGDFLRYASYLVFLILAICYLFAISISGKETPPTELQARKKRFLTWVLVPYLVFSLTSLVFYPHLSRPVDTIDYGVHARVWTVYQENPYQTAGINYKDTDPLVRFMEVKNRPSVYGPVWMYLSVAPAFLGQDDPLLTVLFYKLLFFLLGLLCLFMVWSFYKFQAVDSRGCGVLTAGITLAWNPILHLISHGEGHNDIAMAIFIALMIYALALQKGRLSVLAWSGSVLVKFITAPLIAPSAVLLSRGKQKLGDGLRHLVKEGIFGVLLIPIAILPFGFAAISQTILGRYGGLLNSGGDSKIMLAAKLINRISGLAGIHFDQTMLFSIIGILLPITWGVYTLLRSLSVRNLNQFIKVSIESLLFYVTFVSIPVYAQYSIAPVVLLAFMTEGKWHRLAVILTSLLLVWDSLYLVYPPAVSSTWEVLFHQLSHASALIVFLIFLFSKFFTARVSRLSTSQS